MTPSDEPQILYEGKFLRLVKRGRWEYAERPGIPGAVAIIAVTDAGELVLVEQPRIPLDCHTIELPAGLAGDEAGREHEDFAETARRELLEETGFAAREVTLLAHGATSAGLTSEAVTLFRATGLTRVNAGGGHEGESIVVHLVPLADVPRWLDQQQRAGRVIDLKIFAALYFAAQAS